MPRLVIIGAGMASARLLQHLVELDHGYDIELISEEALPNYNRILLSTLLAKGDDSNDLHLLGDDWYAKHHISLHTSESVVAIDTKNQCVTTSKDRKLDYDALVLATGSSPFIPPIEGVESPGVFAFRNIKDLEQIRNSAQPEGRTAVIGGGLLGLEAAAGLLTLNQQVTVINRESWLMPRQLDETAAGLLQKNLEQRGIDFRLGVTPVAIHSEQGQPTHIVLSDGEQLATDMIVISAGIIPNKSLAESAGIACERAVLVDEHLATNIDNIYAIGECCQFDGMLFGLVDPVYRQAEILARSLCKLSGPGFAHKEVPTELKVAGLDVVSAGALPYPADSQQLVLIDQHTQTYRRLVFKEGKLIGYLLIGDSRFKSAYRQLLDSGQEVGSSSAMMFAANPALPTAANSAEVALN